MTRKNKEDNRPLNITAVVSKNIENVPKIRTSAEHKFQATEQRLRAMFAQAAVGIAVSDLDGRFIEANQKFHDILGYSAEEVYQLTFADITHPEDLTVTHDLVHQLLDGTRTNYAVEKRYIRKDGTTIWSHSTVTLLRYESGEAAQFIGVIEDISARKRAEEVQAQLVAIVEDSDDAIITKTLEGIISTWNPAAEHMFGYTAAEVIGQPIAMLIPADHIDEEPAILERLRRGEKISHYETIRKTKLGKLLNISLSVSPVRDPHGRITGASKIARDITSQKLAEHALQEQTRMLALLESTGRNIAAQLDLESVIQTVTDAATELSGARFGAFFYNVVNESGESFLLYTLSGASREEFANFGLPRNTPIFSPTFSGEGIVRLGDVTKDPRYGAMPTGHLPVRSYLAVPVVLRSGEVIGGLFFGHPDTDVFTERVERFVAGVAAQAAIAIDNARLYETAQRELANRERAEAALREADRRKDEFIATLAHELRNPLAPIRQAVFISKANTATEAQKRWSREVITRQVEHMSLLLDDLLDISRVTRGMLELRIQMTALQAVVDTAIETARSHIEIKRHHLVVDVPTENVLIAADPLRLAQVLANLLNNAAKYTDSEGKIHLQATVDAESVTITVSDTGIGIAAEAIPLIFGMFSQVKSVKDRSEGGLGIGLALAKGLVTMHNGTIEASSPGLGRGSKFIVRLPRRELPISVTPEPPITAVSHSAACNVLIADDNRDAAESLAMLLRMEGHHVTTVNNGRDAIATFNRILPDAAILDIGMSDLNGYEVARQIREHHAEKTFILIAVTGWGQATDKEQAVAAGFDYHFTKPVESQRLIELLSSNRIARACR